MMTKQFLLGTVAAMFIAGPASALTMTPIADNRMIGASGQAGDRTDSDTDSPGLGFPEFNSEVSALAVEFEDFGASAGGNAQQRFSQIGPLSISGSGSADAFGSHGEVPLTAALGVAETPPDLGFGEFLGGANSVLEILFHIDEAASFDIEGFITARIGQAVGIFESGSDSFSSVSLHNDVTHETVFEEMVSAGEETIDFSDSGVIQAGNYLFTLRAGAGVFGGLVETLTVGDSDSLDTGGYETSANFFGRLLLSPTDQPIPEPVTTSLIGMGLGALVLRTSRRRRA